MQQSHSGWRRSGELPFAPLDQFLLLLHALSPGRQTFREVAKGSLVL